MPEAHRLRLLLGGDDPCPPPPPTPARDPNGYYIGIDIYGQYAGCCLLRQDGENAIIQQAGEITFQNPNDLALRLSAYFKGVNALEVYIDSPSNHFWMALLRDVFNCQVTPTNPNTLARELRARQTFQSLHEDRIIIPDSIPSRSPIREVVRELAAGQENAPNRHREVRNTEEALHLAIAAWWSGKGAQGVRLASTQAREQRLL